MTNPFEARSNDRAALASGPRRQSWWATTPIWCWLLLLTALAASFGVSEWEQRDATEQTARRAHTQARRIIDAFEADLAKLELIARSVVSTLAAGARFDERNWSRYVDGLRLQDAYGDAILSVAFAERVPQAVLEQHLASQRRLHAEYAVKPDMVRDTYYPIVLMRRITEPEVPAPIGFDPFTVPERRAAMAAALARRDITYSGAIIQVRASGPDSAGAPSTAPGVILVSPVFPEEADRPESGFVGITFRPNQFIARTVGTATGIGATLTLTTGESGPVELRIGSPGPSGDVTVRETTDITRGDARWRLDVVVHDTIPTQTALLATLIAGSLALFGLAIAFDRGRQQARAALAEARADGDARFRDFAKDAPFILWVCDRDLQPTFVNDAWGEATGQPSEVARGRGWRDFVHPDDLPAVTETFRKVVLAPAPCTVRARTRMKDGSYRWYLANVRPRRDADGNHVGFIGITFDIDELKSAENALERERGLLRGVLDGSPACIFAKDVDHRYILMNPAVKDLMGLEADKFIGRTDIDFYPPEAAALNMSQDDYVLQHGASLRTQEPFVDGGGRRRWMLKTKNPVTLSTGEQMVVGWALDITDLKRLETEAAVARRRIEALHQLATRTLAGESPAALRDLAIGAIETLIAGARARLLPLSGAATDRATPEGFEHAPAALALLQSGNPMVLPGGASDLPAEESAGLLPGDARARITAPLGAGDRLRGALSVESDDERDWTADEIQATVEIAGALTAALEFCDSRAERDRAECALNESRLLLDGIIEGLPVGLAVKDETGRWILTNEALAAITGRPRDSLVGRTNDEIFPPDVARVFDEEDDAVMDTGVPVSVEWQITNPASRMPWVVKSKSRLTLPDGRRFLISAMADITPQKQAILEVERNRRFLDALLNALPQAVYVRDRAGVVILANQAYFHHTQRRPDEVMGRSTREIYGDAVGLILERQDEEVWAAGKAVTFEQRTMDPRIIARWQLKSKTPITMEDGSRYMVGVSADITPLKQAAADLERSKQFVEALIDAVPQGIFVKDAEGRWILVNETFLRLLHLRRGDIIGRTNREIFGPVNGARFDEQDEIAWRGSAPLLYEEESPTTIDGATMWQSKSKTAMTMADGSRYLICTVLDSTDRRSADLALQRNRAFLNAIIDAVPVLIFVKDAAHRVGRAATSSGGRTSTCCPRSTPHARSPRTTPCWPAARRSPPNSSSGSATSRRGGC